MGLFEFLTKTSVMNMTAKRYRLLTFWTCVGMFVVLLVGVLVTNLDAGRGCGDDFPLCNGKFVPAYTLESIVEYSHRAVSGIVGLLMVAAFAATLLPPYRTKESLFYAGGGLLFTVLQAALGAIAVMWPQSDAVMALHFGFSLFAFTFTWLLSAWGRRLWQAETAAAAGSGIPGSGGSGGSGSGGSGVPGAGGSGVAGGARVAAAANGGGYSRRASAPADRPVPRAVFNLVIAVLVYSYVVIYLGAYIRHTGSGGGCSGWPLCNGEWVPSLEGATAIAFAHRSAALALVLAVAAMALAVRRLAGEHRELVRLAYSSVGLVVLQVLSGGLLALTMGDENLYVFTALLHTMIIAVLFAQMGLLAVRSWQLARVRAQDADGRPVNG
jgi:cytochrome c oxidase assembly protein subunit 15